MPWSNNRMWFCGMDDLGFEMKSSGTNTNSKKSTLDLRVGLDSRVGSKSKNLISHFFPSTKCDYPKEVVQFQNLWIQESMLAREMGPNWVRVSELTLIRNLKLNHKIEERVHIHVQVQCQFD